MSTTSCPGRSRGRSRTRTRRAPRLVDEIVCTHSNCPATAERAAVEALDHRAGRELARRRVEEEPRPVEEPSTTSSSEERIRSSIRSSRATAPREPLPVAVAGGRPPSRRAPAWSGTRRARRMRSRCALHLGEPVQRPLERPRHGGRVDDVDVAGQVEERPERVVDEQIHAVRAVDRREPETAVVARCSGSRRRRTDRPRGGTPRSGSHGSPRNGRARSRTQRGSSRRSARRTAAACR